MKTKTFLAVILLSIVHSHIYAQSSDTIRRLIETDNYYEFPSFTGGNLKEWVRNHFIYPLAAFEAGLTGKIYINFVIKADGQVDNISIRRIPESIDTIFDRAVTTLFQSMPRWEPGKLKKKYVSVSYTAPIAINPSDALLAHAEEMPIPAGKWLRRAVQKKKAIRYKIGKREIISPMQVVVSFIIEKDGQITFPEITKSSGHPHWDGVAIHLLQMQSWSPGRHKGIPVRIRYTLPITFY